MRPASCVLRPLYIKTRQAISLSGESQGRNARYYHPVRWIRLSVRIVLAPFIRGGRQSAELPNLSGIGVAEFTFRTIVGRRKGEPPCMLVGRFFVRTLVCFENAPSEPLIAAIDGIGVILGGRFTEWICFTLRHVLLLYDYGKSLYRISGIGKGYLLN